MRASYLEIYNEDIRDLLSKNPQTKLEMKESPDKGVYIKDLMQFVVKSKEEINSVLQVGARAGRRLRGLCLPLWRPWAFLHNARRGATKRGWGVHKQARALPAWAAAGCGAAHVHAPHTIPVLHASRRGHLAGGGWGQLP